MAGLSVRDEVDYENTESMHCIIGTVYTVDGFLHSSQKVQCYTTLPSLKHIFNSHTGQLQPGALDLQT